MGVRPENIGELQRQVEPANCGQRDAYIRNRKVPLRKKELVTQRIIHNSEQTSSFQMRGSYRVVIALGLRHSREAQKCDPQCGPQRPQLPVHPALDLGTRRRIDRQQCPLLAR